MPTQAERLASVETELRGLRVDVRETKEDVKTLLAAYNRQRGFISFAKLAWMGLAAVAGAALKWAHDNWRPHL